jgi:hypothetical protein
MGMFGFKPKTDEVLDHWISFADGLSLSSQEFYTAVEKELENRKIPGLRMSRIEYAEGGLLSDKRIYLRMLRERLAFDTCAAPFGKTFFFSCRCIHSPPSVRLWHIVAVFLLFNIAYSVLIVFLGFIFSIVAMVALVLAILETFRNAGVLRVSDLDNFLMNIPAIGPIYERWFRLETYYREDTRLLYLKLVPDLIKKVAGDMTGEKGVKLMQQYERAPILGELYKPLKP